MGARRRKVRENTEGASAGNALCELSMTDDIRIRRALKAIDAGLSWLKVRTVGRSLGRSTLSEILPKADVPPALIHEWKRAKRARKRKAKNPFTTLNPAIRNCLYEIEDELGIKNTGNLIDLGNDISLRSISAPAEVFEPHSGLAWYGLEIERLYDNARRHMWIDDGERAAYQAFKLGQLYAEFQLMKHAGQFFEQAVLVKDRQRDAGRSSIKRSPSERQEAYFHFRAQGDKPINAARHAADLLGVSLSTVRNAFPGSRLPKTPDNI